MLRSMTGYGRGEALLHDRRFVVEIKSVNHRYSDINIRLPRVLNPFEDRLRKQAASQAARGKVDIYISMDSFAKTDIRVTLNEPVADAYMEQLRRAIARYNLRDDGSLSLLMGFSDVLEVDKATDDATLDQMREGAEMAFTEALKRFVTMRETEGAALGRDLSEKLARVEGLVRQVTDRAPQVMADYRARLRTKLNEVLADTAIDENRILSETVLFADRCCVDEELTRLTSHLQQFDGILSGGTGSSGGAASSDGEAGAVGRKLDFLVQEINREINTVGSKSNDLEITRLVVDLKTELEKIREQVQNIE